METLTQTHSRTSLRQAYARSLEIVPFSDVSCAILGHIGPANGVSPSMKKILIVCAVLATAAACSSDPDPAGSTSSTDAGPGTGTDAGKDSAPAIACTATSCNGHGVCSASTTAISCVCDAGYGGTTCTECAAGQQDKDGNKTCAPACTATTCSSHGTCNDSTGTAACTCDAGYAGANCTTCAMGYQDKNNDKICTLSCATTGACSNHGTCSDASGTATCTCATGYTGPACAACATDYQDKDNNKTCTPSCSATTCTSAANGTCLDTSGTATCTCLGHFAGPACATCATNFTGAACNSCVAGKGGPNCDYSIVYGLNLPTNGQNGNNFGIAANLDAAYDVNNSAGAGAFTRVAYRLVLGAAVAPEEVWVEMDAFTADKTKLGVPSDWVFDQAVMNVSVVSKAANTASIAVPTAGYIEFWSNCYAPTGGNDAVYDYKDTLTQTDCYGSMQVHVGTNTVIAYNRWANNNVDVEGGFGNQAVGNPDWTFAVNMASYATRRLEVYVK